MNPIDQNSGFDSMLDTMTNAVGILIVILAIANLTLQDTVNRVAKTDITPVITQQEEYQKLKTELERLDSLSDVMGAEWKAAKRHAQFNEAQLKQIKKKYSLVDHELIKNDQTQVIVQTLAQQVKKNRKKYQSLKGEVERLKQEIKNSQNVFNLQRNIPKSKITIARVPDPIPAPIDSKRVSFFCRFGQVVHFSENKMTRILNKGIQAALSSDESMSTTTLNQYGKIVDYFDKNIIAQEGLRWRIKVKYRVSETSETYRELKAYIEWSKEDVGESLADIQKKESEYQKVVAALIGKKVYAKYHVWGDSFPEYAIAREIIDEYKIPAGWVAHEENKEYSLLISQAKMGQTSSRLKDPTKMNIPKVYSSGGPRISLGGGGRISFAGSGSAGGSSGLSESGSGVDYID